MTRRLKISVVLTLVCAALGLAATVLLGWQSTAAAETAPVGASTFAVGAHSWAFIAAALATGLSSLGAGFAVANVGAAAVGALAEKPELLGRALILVGLAEGIAIYGLIVSILILNRLG
jgi:V/A-type H+-transporting ATPase subunit K